MAVHPASSLLQRAQRLCHELSTACTTVRTRSGNPHASRGAKVNELLTSASTSGHSSVSRRAMSSTTRLRSLNIDNINPHVKAAKYAVRGEIATKSEEYRAQLKKAASRDPPTPPENPLPFDSVISANIGNPQQLGQKPITFFRQVLALVEYPPLLENEQVLKEKLGYKQDAIDRARWLLNEVGSVGAYSQSAGAPAIRESVAKYIENRDGFSADPSSIYLSAGASSGVNTLMHIICSKPETGVLIPIPQYPLYSASLAVLNARGVNYYLDESKGWGTDLGGIKESYEKAKKDGTDVRAIVVINPGNPTGACLSADEIKEIIKFAAEENLVVLADEVYQTNIFSGEFNSFKKCLRELQRDTPKKYDYVELASLHSASKGMVGECGHRAGYFELVGFDSEVQAQLVKFISIVLCPPVVGQCLIEMMVNPPVPGDPSYELYKQEYDSIADGLHKRALALYDAFEKMEGVEVVKPQGSMYLFPTLNLPPRAVEAAKKQNKQVDEYYCMRLLDATGICVVPGTGFGQKPGTMHLRTTFLAPGTDWVNRIEEFHRGFMEEFR